MIKLRGIINDILDFEAIISMTCRSLLVYDFEANMLLFILLLTFYHVSLKKCVKFLCVKGSSNFLFLRKEAHTFVNIFF